ncbi:MAG: hypothetical protein PUB22_10185 [Clostridiales bacterium]|nr:hypothetical protein [Clostridiales bacterium]
MSKEKVDAYRASKTTRKQDQEKARKKRAAKRKIAWAVAILCVAGIAAALGLTVKSSYDSYKASLPTYDASTQVVQDFAGVLDADEEAEDADTTADDAEETEAPEETTEE